MEFDACIAVSKGWCLNQVTVYITLNCKLTMDQILLKPGTPEFRN